MRTLAFGALTASRQTDDRSAASAARAGQMAVAVAYTHLDLTVSPLPGRPSTCWSPAVYAAQAREFSTAEPDAADAELSWAAEHSNADVRRAVRAMPVPDTGRSRLGQLYQTLDSALRRRSGPRVSVDTIGAWVIKCNPARTAIEPMVAAGETKPHWCRG